MNNNFTMLDSNYNTIKTVTDTKRAVAQQVDLPKDITLNSNWNVVKVAQDKFKVAHAKYNLNK